MALAITCMLAVAGCASTVEPAADALPAAPAVAAAPIVASPATKPPSARPPVVPVPAPAAESMAKPPPSLGADELAKAVASYDDGDYAAAAKQFQAALDLGLPLPNERAIAHKHLAFMACVAKRTSACRAEFRKAMGADPGFELAAAEAGHPVWGPVYRRVKADAIAAEAARAKKK